MEILRTGNAIRKKLDQIEQQIADLQQQKKSVAAACVPHAETRARLVAAIESKLNLHNTEFHFNAFQTGVNPQYAVLPDVFGVADLAYIQGIDTLADKILARIQVNGRPIGLAAAERVKRIEDLQTQIKKAEHDAELAALALEAAGHTVLRRDSADVESILDVWASVAA